MDSCVNGESEQNECGEKDEIKIQRSRWVFSLLALFAVPVRFPFGVAIDEFGGFEGRRPRIETPGAVVRLDNVFDAFTDFAFPGGEPVQSFLLLLLFLGNVFAPNHLPPELQR